MIDTRIIRQRIRYCYLENYLLGRVSGKAIDRMALLVRDGSVNTFVDYTGHLIAMAGVALAAVQRRSGDRHGKRDYQSICTNP